MIYCLDVETFFDDDGDGIGDFAGLTQRVDYLAALGVTCIWLMPFYPSPDRDDGYDISDFFGVDRRLGTMGDFVEFIRTAKDRGIRVIAISWSTTPRTSIRGSRQRAEVRDNPYRDYYVWRDDTPPNTSSARWCSRASRPPSGPRTTPPASGTCTCSPSTSRT